ncbi:uncharacterized protein PAC_03477 [Phialocephala subalpina]|uniref:NAD(P)-binding domain-containing protein n=1 Tax=Phialocephala subalpina TaxID=576137 RepID=A0A1L7WLD5_9HELO|nr:uncharacterized protein PAC_03477 [Phialocephala subalpina]
MHILILGGTGRVGRLIIAQALSRGHQVTALVRSPSSLTPQPNLNIIEGQSTSQSDISTALSSSPTNPLSAVIIALASVRETESPFSKSISPPRLMTDTHKAVIAAMKSCSPPITRLITISSFGVGDSKPFVFWPMRYLLSHFGIGAAFEDHNALEPVVRESGLEWTLVRSVMMGDGGKGEVKVFGERGEGIGWMPKIGREAVAGFVIEECLEGGKWVDGTPVIANA